MDSFHYQDGLPGLRIDEARRRRICIGCAIALPVILLLALFSLATVHPTQFGLQYNQFTKNVNKNVLGQGRHFIGPWSTMIRFPSIVKTIEFSERESRTAGPLKTRTVEGLDIAVQVAFQYQLQADGVFRLYNRFKTSYNDFFWRRGADVLLKVAGSYEATQYWTNRKAIADQMKLLLHETLAENGADVTDLEILIVDLPDSYEKKIVDTQVQVQIIKTRSAEQEAAVIRANIEVMVSNFTRQQQIILNGAHAEGTLITKTAEAQAQGSKIDVETEALTRVTDLMNLTIEGLVRYQRGLAYQNLDETQFLFGVENAVAVLGKPGQGDALQNEEVCSEYLEDAPTVLSLAAPPAAAAD